MQKTIIISAVTTLVILTGVIMFNKARVKKDPTKSLFK